MKMEIVVQRKTINPHSTYEETTEKRFDMCQGVKAEEYYRDLRSGEYEFKDIKIIFVN